MAETPLERTVAGLAIARIRAIACRWPAALALILLLGGMLRFNGLGWDQPKGADIPLQMHPDERFLSLVSDRISWPGFGGYFDTAHSTLNPYNDPETHSFVYGTFPLFVAKGVSSLAGSLPGELSLGPWGIPLPNGHGDSYEGTVFWGRRITALFDVGTIALVFALGWSLFGKRAALLGALFYALAVLPTQLSHFWTMDPFLVFFGASVLLGSVHFVRAKRERDLWLSAVLIGIGLGLAMACKVNAVLFIPAITGAAAVRVALRDFPQLGLRWKGSVSTSPGNWMTDLAVLSFALALALLTFRFAQPYAFSGPHVWDMSLNPVWRNDLQREYDFQNGDVDYPPFVQFAGRSPFITPLRNLVLFGFGPALGIAAIVALAAGGVLLFKRREMTFLLPLLFVGAVFTFQGMRFVAFMRYFEPIYPVLCLVAGWALVNARWPGTRETRLLGGLAGRLSKPGLVGPRTVSVVAVVVVAGGTAFWALAIQNVYRAEQPRIEASRWIYQNIPPGSAITSELWDDSLPYLIPGQAWGQYRNIELEPYQTDSEEKVRELVYGRPRDAGKGGLANADYVILASNRVRDSVVRLPAEYPATIRYYQLLDSGALGFEEVAHFDRRPSFLGLTIDDSGAEESFTVYDHPEVRIYQKTAAFDAAKAVALLEEAHPERAINLLPRQGRTNGLQLTPAEEQAQQSGGTFTGVFDGKGWASSIPWAWWLLWLEVAAFAALPWVTWLFRALPDRGYGLSKVLGLSAVVLPVWALVAWGPARFSGVLAWSVMGAAVLAGVALAVVRRRMLMAEARARWRSWLAMEVAFLGAFAVFLLLRAWNPDLWYHPQGGEKPMEIAYLTAVVRSTELPPYDPWFAGGSMNYYYMGWFFLAVPIRALELLPEVAFNLGGPTFAALGAATAYSTVHNLVALAARGRKAAIGETRRWRRPAIAAGALGVVFVLFLANLDGLHQTVERFQSIDTWHVSSKPVVGGFFGIIGGWWRWAVHNRVLPPFDWWRSSRVHFGQFDITEFPYFSLLFGDLHPHLMDVPFFGLVIALGVSYVVTVRTEAGRIRGWLLAALIGLTVGLIRTVHTWDFPTAVLIGFGAIAAGQAVRRARWQERWWLGVGHVVTAGAVLVVFFAPYTAHFETFDPGLIRAPQTTKVHQYFVQYGVFVVLAVLFLAVRYHEELALRGRDHGRNPLLASVNGWMEIGALAVFAAGLGAFTYTFGLATVALASLIEVYFLNLLWLEWRATDRDLPRMLATAMFALAFAISAGVDVVTLKNDIVRMNTVFKFGIQAWQLFALGSAFAAWYCGQALWDVRGARLRPIRGRGLAAVVATSLTGLLVVSSAIYLWSGTRARQEARFADIQPTLNGMAFLPSAYYQEDIGTSTNPRIVTVHLSDDQPLITWLRENVQGSPVIAEAVGPLYHWTGRISEYTGLPAVIGWDWHQVQQRTDYQPLIDRRRVDMASLYTTSSTDLANQYLRKYNVSYLVVGTEEVLRGTDEGLAKFDTMPALSRVFSSGDYRIYRVDQSRLAPGQ